MIQDIKTYRAYFFENLLLCFVFRLKKENEAIKDILDIFLSMKKIITKQVRIGSFWSNNYIEYESNGDRNKTLSTEEYLNKTRRYLKDIINDLKKYDTWKIQLTIINFHFF